MIDFSLIHDSRGVMYALAGCGIMGMGLYIVLFQASLIRKILGINVMGSGLFLLIVSLAYSPIVWDGDRGGVWGVPDAISHSLVITGLVVSVSATALYLAIYIRLHQLTGELSLDVEPQNRTNS